MEDNAKKLNFFLKICQKSVKYKKNDDLCAIIILKMIEGDKISIIYGGVWRGITLYCAEK